jgi:hypothetical protein
VFGSPSSLLMRSDVIRGREALFDEARFPRHWDSSACFELLRSGDFGFVHQVLTFTRRPAEARTAFSRRLNSYLAERVIALQTFGPEFLSAGELRRRRQLQHQYYAFLGRNLNRDEDAFWDYHRRAMATAELRPGRLQLRLASLESRLPWRLRNLIARLDGETAEG